MKSNSLSASIRRMLLLRLSLATIVLSLLFAALAFYNNQQRIEQEVVELARLRTGQFNLYIRDLLDSPEALSPVVLQQKLNDFIDESGQAVIRDGYFVLVRIYDQSGHQLLERAEENFAAMPAIRQAVDSATISALAPEGPWSTSRGPSGLARFSNAPTSSPFASTRTNRSARISFAASGFVCASAASVQKCGNQHANR